MTTLNRCHNNAWTVADTAKMLFLYNHVSVEIRSKGIKQIASYLGRSTVSIYARKSAFNMGKISPEDTQQIRIYLTEMINMLGTGSYAKVASIMNFSYGARQFAPGLTGGEPHKKEPTIGDLLKAAAEKEADERHDYVIQLASGDGCVKQAPLMYKSQNKKQIEEHAAAVYRMREFSHTILQVYRLTKCNITIDVTAKIS